MAHARPLAGGPRLDLSRRIPAIDGLRGVAIAGVVFAHYVWFQIPNTPAFAGYVKSLTRPVWSSVDLFFVLSGFLIGGKLLDARDSRNYFSTFYVHRFCRVLPIYFLFLGLVGLAYLTLYRAVGARLDWLFGGALPWYSYISFAQNFWMAKRNAGGAFILAITWAFAVEVQFYLVIPYVIRYVRRPLLPYIFASGFALAPVARLFIISRFRAHYGAAYVLLPCRMDALFAGLLCAYFLRDSDVWSSLVQRRFELWVAFIGLLLGVPFLCTAAMPFTLLWAILGYGWMSALYAVALTLVVVDSNSRLSRAMQVRWLVGLGTISYGVYLFHYGIYGLCMTWLLGHWQLLTDWKSVGVTALATVLSFGLGKLSWEHFEKPIVRWGHSWKYRKRSLVVEMVGQPGTPNELRT